AVAPWLLLTGEASSYRGAFTVNSLMAGPQLRMSISRFEPFIQGLGGVSRLTGVTRFSAAGGGGLDVFLNDRLAVRVLQADFFVASYVPRNHLSDFSRISFGVVYRFGE